MPAGRILVVEDEDKLRRVVQLHLESAGFDADGAASAEQAMPLAGLADLIITDLRLPGIDGLQFIQQFATDAAHPLNPKVARAIATTQPTMRDIAIAYETLAREAEADGKPFAAHLAHLAVHGFLHLLGYDHELDEQACAMERLEREILARLDIADPYATRDAGA